MRKFVLGSSVISFRSEECTVIATDNQLSYGSLAKHRASKIFVFDATVLAFSGEYSDVQRIVSFIRREVENEDEALITTSYFKMIQRLLYSHRSQMKPLNVQCVVGGREFLGCIDHLGDFFESDVVCTGMGAHLATPYLRASGEEPMVRIRRAMELMVKRDCRASNEVQIATINDSGIRVEDEVLSINWDLGNNNEIVYI